MRQIVKEMRQLTVTSQQELFAAAKNHQAPYELIKMVAEAGKAARAELLRREASPPPADAASDHGTRR